MLHKLDVSVCIFIALKCEQNYLFKLKSLKNSKTIENKTAN